MSAFTIQASYKKSENTSELKPTIHNNVTIHQSNTPALPVEPVAVDSSVVLPRALPRVRPASTPPKMMDVIPEDAVKIRALPVTEQDADFSPFEQRLLSIVLAVLSSQDKTLIMNVIDQSGDIILHIDDLKELLRLVTQASKITIATSHVTIKCGCSDILSGKPLPIWQMIDNIIVDGEDFFVAFNKYYHRMKQYKISMEKVVV